MRFYVIFILLVALVLYVSLKVAVTNRNINLRSLYGRHRTILKIYRESQGKLKAEALYQLQTEVPDELERHRYVKPGTMRIHEATIELDLARIERFFHQRLGKQL